MVARGKHLDIGEFCKKIQERGEERDNTRRWLADEENATR